VEATPIDAEPRGGEDRPFLLKAARSVAELQPKVNNIADVMVFLEVLGYTRDDALRHGFSDLHELSRRIYEFLDILEHGEEGQPETSGSLIAIPTTARRLAEGFALSFGWLGSLVVLFLAGVSLWLSLIMPLKYTTAFMAGLFAGLFVTEGPLQGFNRLFSFYHNMGNLAEAKRVLKRAYVVSGLVVGITAVSLYLASVLVGFPLDLFEVMMVSFLTISFHRVTYGIVYALRKAAQIVVSFSLAVAVLLYIYFDMGDLILTATTRYFVALGAAVLVLSAFGFYEQYQVLAGKSFHGERDAPSFFRKVTFNRRTIRSSFSVQFWETMPNYLYGTFFFALIFGDRILSWFFNPLKRANGIALPFVFNSTYHAGADPALLVIFPALIAQFTMMSPLFAQVTNRTLLYTVSEAGKVQSMIERRYYKVMAVSVLCSVVTLVALDYLAPLLLPATILTPTSLRILHIASFADVLLVVFFANSAFMFLMNRGEGLALMAMAGALVVAIGGFALGRFDFQNLVVAYLMATASVALVSTMYVLKNLGHASSMFFARYV
jgi:hypothetical protein